MANGNTAGEREETVTPRHPPVPVLLWARHFFYGQDNVELTEAVEDLQGLFERNSVGSIIRGALISPSLAVDTHFASAVSNLSPLLKLPVDVIQRGRDHGKCFDL